MLNPVGFLLWGLKPSKIQYYKRTFLLLGFSLGICRVLGFCPGVTGFYILGREPGMEVVDAPFGSQVYF